MVYRDGSADSWGYNSESDENHWDDSQVKKKRGARNEPSSTPTTNGLLVALDGDWYELDKLASQHPGGKRILTKVKYRYLRPCPFVVFTFC